MSCRDLVAKIKASGAEEQTCCKEAAIKLITHQVVSLCHLYPIKTFGLNMKFCELHS